MPDHYAIPEDNKVYTRYSELVHCVEGTATFVTAIKRRMLELPGIETVHTKFGTLRHEMMATESVQSNRLPSHVIEAYPHLGKHSADMVEKTLYTEVFPETEKSPAVVLISQPDFVSTGTGFLADHKKITQQPSGLIKKPIHSYAKSMQHKVYAWQLLARDVIITDFAYIGEVWNPDLTTFIGCQVYEGRLSLSEIVETRTWIRERVTTLIKGIALFNKGIIR